MARVLIAPLGESPIVVTAMVEALEHHPDAPHARIEVVEVLHPTGYEGQLIDFGVELIQDALQGQCEVRVQPLGFPDANSEENCVAYLHVLNALLEAHAEDEVYVSVAGGRKSLAALTAVITQFHPQIRGLYHILDRHERDNRRQFLSIEELFNLADSKRRALMIPTLEDLVLVPIPFQPLARAADLRRYLAQGRAGEGNEHIVVGDNARAFFERVFGQVNGETGERIEIRFSSTAYEQFRNFDPNKAERFWNCFRNMTQPALLKEGKHRDFPDHGHTFHFYKAGSTAERPFFYTEPNDIIGWPQRKVDRVVVAGLSVHKSDDRYDIEGDEWVCRGPFDDKYTLKDLSPRPGILLVSLGESPMVATQTYALLRDREHLQIERVALLYPGGDPAIRKGAHLIKGLFEDPKLNTVRGSAPVSVADMPVEGLQDVRSREDCERYGQELGNAIARLRDRYPDQPIYLSLSGGRKAMAALTYFGAQQAGLSQVWHTTISDPELDKQVERETTLENLDRLKKAEQAARFFLQAYDTDRGKFTIFPVPVISLNFNPSA